MKPIILAANGAHANRGCQAIEAGTVEVLNRLLPGHPKVFMPLAESPSEDRFPVAPEDGYERLDLSIRESPIRRVAARLGARPFPNTLCTRLAYAGKLRGLSAYAETAAVVLSLGGDTYSLDYGWPSAFWALDDAVLSRGCPLVLWGASVGPFASSARYERYAGQQLSRCSLIMAREEITNQYLRKMGLAERVVRVADPAFLMRPLASARALEAEPPRGCIGLNLSPMYLKRMSPERDPVETGAAIVEAVAREFDEQIVLVPHVVLPESNDHALLTAVAGVIENRGLSVQVLPADLNSAEMKHVISTLRCLIGARTHATIAALSSGVPTISLAYSVKAHGINLDIFGHDEYVLPIDQATPTTVAGRTKALCNEEDEVRAYLTGARPRMESMALRAGEVLAELVGKER